MEKCFAVAWLGFHAELLAWDADKEQVGEKGENGEVPDILLPWSLKLFLEPPSQY